ncbi:MAG: ABC transporter ATP-binding protein, partial [Caulobacter sp. 39-67-4]
MKMTPLGGSDRPDADGLFVDAVGKSFGDRPVVKSVSLRLKRGEVAGLLGPNGAGKTTCFYMITGLIAADYGSIYLDGEDITAQPMFQRARLGVGYLPQEASIFRGMTVEQNVMAVVEMREKNQRAAAETVTNILEELRITHIRKSPAVALSGGERRRVEI